MTDRREQIAEIIAEAQDAAVHATRNPFIKHDAGAYADRIWDEVVEPVLIALLNGDRIEGWATNDAIEWESWDFYADPVRPDGYCRATLIIHPEVEG